MMMMEEWEGDSNSTLGVERPLSRERLQCERCKHTLSESRSGTSSLDPRSDVEIGLPVPSSTPISDSNWIDWEGVRDPENP